MLSTARQTDGSTWVSQATQTKIDKLFRPYARPDSPGYVLGLVKNGELVFAKGYGRPMLDYSGGDTDTSTYMARFPTEHLTIVCLSNMPLGDAENKAHEVLDVLHAAGIL